MQANIITKAMDYNIAIILVEPQMGENIGAIARVMKNFLLKDLRIVNPRDGWPNDKARNISVGALDIIDNAHIYNSVPESINDLEFIYAASARPRDMKKSSVLPRDLVKHITGYRNIGVIFGRESSGLTNEEISYANKIISINTNSDFSSLNISHAVAVICYELFQNVDRNKLNITDFKNNLATKKELDYFCNHLLDLLDDKSFFKDKIKEQNMSIKIRNLFTRIELLSKQEVQTLHGIITTLSNNQ